MTCFAGMASTICGWGAKGELDLGRIRNPLSAGLDFFRLLNTKTRARLEALRSNPAGTASSPGSLPAMADVFPSTL